MLPAAAAPSARGCRHRSNPDRFRRASGRARPHAHHVFRRSMLLRRFHADWVLPIVSPPIAHGCVTVVDDRVIAVGTSEAAYASLSTGAEVQDIQLGRVA